MTWWEQTNDGTAPISRVPVVCPVCKSTLAARIPNERLWIYCQECHTDFYFAPDNDIPTRATPDSLKCGAKKCGCGRCGS